MRCGSSGVNASCRRAACTRPQTDQESRSRGRQALINVRGMPHGAAANTHRGQSMKTMTCKQMGGPCDAAFSGNSGDEVIKAQDKHLKEMVAGGDETHQSALK